MVVTRTLQNPQFLSFCLLTSTKNSDGKSYYVYQKSLEFVNIKGPAQTPLLSEPNSTDSMFGFSTGEVTSALKGNADCFWIS